MKTQRVLIALTLVNCGLLIFQLAQTRAVEAQSAATVLRGRALEIVDDRGRVRASIKVQPEDPAVRKPNGKPYPENVLFRLIDPNGRPEVKLGASVEGAGLGLIGETDTTHVLLQADGADTLLKLTNRDGRERLMKP